MRDAIAGRRAHPPIHLVNTFIDRMKKKDRKIFVLDTSVILYDHSAIECFEEHDVAIPIQVLEELDTFKKGRGGNVDAAAQGSRRRPMAAEQNAHAAREDRRRHR